MQLPASIARLTKRNENSLATTGKQAALRTRLLKGLTLSAIILGTLGAVAWASSEIEDYYTARTAELTDKVAKINTDIAATEKKLSQAEAMLPLYQKLVSEQGGVGILLDRQQAEKIINATKNDFLLPMMQAAINPPQDMKDEKYKNEFVAGIACDISLSFEALSDEHIIQTLHHLQETLPGGVRISALTMHRNKSFSATVVKDIMHNGPEGLVKANAKITWMGMKETAAPSAAPPAAKP